VIFQVATYPAERNAFAGFRVAAATIDQFAVKSVHVKVISAQGEALADRRIAIVIALCQLTAVANTYLYTYR
jgi:hypothetical protein